MRLQIRTCSFRSTASFYERSGNRQGTGGSETECFPGEDTIRSIEPSNDTTLGMRIPSFLLIDYLANASPGVI